MNNLIALICGAIFGAGLLLSGMLDTTKVIHFLDVTGQWDSTLLIVMASALAVTVPAFFGITQRNKPLLDHLFHIPKTKVINKPLLIGSSLFGIGWGIYGYCPGPAIAASSQMNANTLMFLMAMFIGMFAARWFSVRWFSAG